MPVGGGVLKREEREIGTEMELTIWGIVGGIVVMLIFLFYSLWVLD